ncbi:hypothetical protein KRR38_05805 [Novosphingobium sp. G106]|uniref:hypothetical protein n=1 Tax=Novosphingobium sp. G106 TaxID=2849500 RepID=UPI001C2D37EB|nr:hypothetical protein [Novosphingobium sp. G106]MBV1687198.1 hypothetical protein [Novosphingobium sp. G106]
MNSVVTAYPDALPEATSTSLSLPESLTFEQWEEIGAELANRARKLNWWIGDWWAAGHHRYGERARLAARGLFGKEFKTLANIASVCRAFEPSRRREHLSWSHHAEASALSPNAADMLLDLAERDRLSKAQVRAAVTTIRGGPSARTVSPDEAAVASLFRAYNRLPGQVRVLVAQAFAAVAATGAEIDPATGNPKAEAPADELQPLPEAEQEAPLDLIPTMEAAAVDIEPEDAWHLAAQDEIAPAEPEPETMLDLADWDSMAVEAEPDAPLDLPPEREATPIVTETSALEPGPQAPQGLAPDMEAMQAAAEDYIEYDLTLDMAALQAETGTDMPLDLASEMAVAPPEAEPDTALDLDLDMAMPEEASSDSAFALDGITRTAGEPGDALDLGPEREEAEETDKAKKAAVRTEPWLLP